MRHGLTLILILLLGGVAWAADGPAPAPAPPAAPADPARKPSGPPDPERTADAVLAAWKAHEAATLAALAAQDEPDPWIVADELIRRGELDAAEAFAKAAPRVDVERLPAYVTSRRGQPYDEETRGVIARMNAALMAKDFPAALDASATAPVAPPTDVGGVRRTFARGLALHGLERLKEGAAAFREAAEAAEGLGWRRRAAHGFDRAGVCAFDHADFRAALAAWERQLALSQLRQDRTGLAVANTNLGLVHRILHNYAKALEYSEQAVKFAEELGNPRGVAHAVRSLGGAYDVLGNMAKSIECFERALKILLEVRDEPAVIATMMELGAAHSHIGNYAKALEIYQRALKRPGGGASAPGIIANIGGIHLSLGNYAKALEHLEQGLRDCEAAGKKQWVAIVLNQLASAYRSLGAPGKALEYFQRSLQLSRELDDRSGVAGTLINLGGLYRELGDEAKAIACYEEGISLSEAIGERRWLAKAYAGLGNAHLEQGDLSRAQEFLERSLKVEEELGNRLGAASELVAIAKIHLLRREHAKGIQLLERAVRAAEKLGANELLLTALSALSQGRLSSGDAARALPDAHRAVSVLKHVVGGLGEEQGATARERHSVVFSAGLAAAAALGDVPEAVFFLESGRAGTMLESLDAREALRQAAIPEGLRLAQDEARAAEKAALLAYARAEDGGDRAAVRARKAELAAAQAKVQDVVERIQREAKKEANLWYPVASPLEDIQALIAPGEALVLYGLPRLNTVAYAVVVTREEARIVSLGRSLAIVEACEALDASGPDGDPAPALDRLRDLLVAPLALGKETTRLLVSPEGPLSYVPFAALLPDLEVAYEMSGTTYGVLLQERVPRGEKTLALGDPDYAAKFNPVALDLYAPLAAVTRGGRLAPLPGTREEAQSIGDVTLFGKDASEPGLRTALAKKAGRWHAVHFACHGIVNPDRPTLSSLALTPDGEEDGFLTALEVLEMELPSDLVVLSACETGTGKIVGGEGIVGLTRAFMYAGSPRVICSLWKVDDEATRALMLRFYELWNPKDGKPGLSTAEALREAQAFIRSQAKWKHPYYWAAWVLWGLPS